MTSITLENVSKVYPDGTRAVSDVSLDVPDGCLMALVGPSGCGKTTLLRMLAGLEVATHGEIRIGDRAVNGVAAKHRDVAMVFQNYALYPHMSVFDNMAFSLTVRRVDKKAKEQKVRAAAEMLGLTDLLDKKPRQLSGGQRQRVAMGRAIVREPQVFLMDEPLSNLDAKLRVHMRSALARMQRELRVTTVFVTHDQTEAMTLGQLAAVMRGGVVQQVAEPQVLYRRPTNLFVAGFIGSPTMNVLRGTVRVTDGATAVEFGENRIDVDPTGAPIGALAAYRDRDVLIGIRPEDLHDGALVPERPASSRVKAVVDLREEVGSEAYVYLEIDGQALPSEGTAALSSYLEGSVDDEAEASPSIEDDRMVARFDASSSAREGDRLEVWVDSAHMHFFDPESGVALVD